MDELVEISQEQMINSMVDIAIESWRFSRLFSRLVEKLDAGESSRYVNQYRYYLKRLEENLKQTGLRIVNLEGQQYDPGMAATALNAEDFDAEDLLIVEQMVEPVIMGPEGIIKPGTVMLKKG